MDSRTALGGYGPGQEWSTAEPLGSARKYFPRVLTRSMTILFLEFLIEVSSKKSVAPIGGHDVMRRDPQGLESFTFLANLS